MHYLIQRYALSKPAIFNDRSMISKSIIFRPPQCFSPMIVFFLILGGLPSQIKLKIILLILSIRDLDTVSNELQYTSFDKPNVLTILILPIKVSFLFFQLLSVFSKEQTFSSKLRVLACFKVIPLKLFYYQTFFETWRNEHS